MDPVAALDVERRAARDPVLAAAVADWRGRLIELDDAASPQAPSDGLWARIEAGIETPSPTPAAALERKPSLFSRLWSDVTALRGAALAGAAASVALAILAGAAYREAQRTPQVIAVLLTSDNRPGAIVEVFADGSSYVAPLSDVSVPSDRIMQVWTLPDRETGPVSLGLLADDGSARLQPVSLPAPKPQQLYEITLEPSGGSPTGKPTGPILFKGFAERPR
ncbi:anti-sigma factor [Chenggangzhangella methanolivorans]|uniref:Anti-sigma factor n=2 Tax=Chenggangzhangella methanolivorans TaxID=1437009 RepID=A0A9E6RCW3_9HYPH|nr:anti-sigma factor [Chenggangzhangella methanolivorans]